MFSSSHTEPQEVWLDVQGIMVCFSLYLPSCKLVCSLPTFGTSFFDKPPTKQWQVRQVSFYYQSKHCTIIGEILQHHHTFALFDLPQRSPPWPLSWVLTFNKQLGVLTNSPPQPPHHNVFEAPDLRVLSRHQWWVQFMGTWAYNIYITLFRWVITSHITARAPACTYIGPITHQIRWICHKIDPVCLGKLS